MTGRTYLLRFHIVVSSLGMGVIAGGLVLFAGVGLVLAVGTTFPRQAFMLGNALLGVSAFATGVTAAWYAHRRAVSLHGPQLSPHYALAVALVWCAVETGMFWRMGVLAWPWAFFSIAMAVAAGAASRHLFGVSGTE